MCFQIIAPQLKLRHQRLSIHPLHRLREHASLALPSPNLTFILPREDDLMETLAFETLAHETAFAMPCNAVDLLQVCREGRVIL